MSRRKIIGDRVVFENPFHKKDIILQHIDDGFELIFDSEVKFRQTATHQTVKIGNFEVVQSDDGKMLEFRKDGKVKFLVE